MISAAKGAWIADMALFCRENRSLVAHFPALSCGRVGSMVTRTLGCPVPRIAPNCGLVSTLMIRRIVCDGGLFRDLGSCSRPGRGSDDLESHVRQLLWVNSATNSHTRGTIHRGGVNFASRRCNDGCRGIDVS
jgi:hypothetical protein